MPTIPTRYRATGPHQETMMRMWAKREEQLKGVLDSTAGLYGDLQGIAGRAMPEIESLDVRMIEANADSFSS